jgi:predicted MFS family arabinose efflux permease
MPLWLLAVVVFVYGCTALGWNGLNQALIVETAGPGHAAVGVGYCMTLTQVGNVGGPPLFGFIVDTTGGYQAAWLFLCALSLAAALLAVLYTRHEERSAKAPSPVPSEA